MDGKPDPEIIENLESLPCKTYRMEDDDE